MSEKQLFVTGRNWGEVDLNGNMLAFLVGSKQAFEVSLADVSQTQLQGKNYVILEFHMNDTTGANEVHDCNSLHRIGRQIIQKTCNAVHSCHISGIQRSVYWDLFLTVRFECMRPIHRSNV